MKKIVGNATKQNMIVARGKLVGLGRNEFGHQGITLFIRGSGQKRPIYLPFALNVNLPANIAVNDIVEVKGYAVAYSYKNSMWKGEDGEGKKVYVQYLVVDEIVKSIPEIKKIFNVEGGFACEDAFARAYFAGKVVSKLKSKVSEEPNAPTWTKLKIQIPSEGEDIPTNTVNVQYSDKMRSHDVTCKVGDTVCLTALLSSKTKRNKEEGFTRHYENFIINDIVVTEIAKETENNTIETNKAINESDPLLGEMLWD